MTSWTMQTFLFIFFIPHFNLHAENLFSYYLYCFERACLILKKYIYIVRYLFLHPLQTFFIISLMQTGI